MKKVINAYARMSQGRLLGQIRIPLDWTELGRETSSPILREAHNGDPITRDTVSWRTCALGTIS